MASFNVELSTLNASLVIEIPGPERSTDILTIEEWVKQEYAAGGQDGLRTTLSTLWVWTLAFPNLLAADFVEIENFYAAVNGNADQWYYTHTDGRQYTVRFWGPLQYRRENSNRYFVTFPILTAEEPNGAS